MGDRSYNFDANLLLSDQVAAYTADGFLQAGGANVALNLGGNQAVSPLQQARMDCMAIFEVSAIKTTSGNETYNAKIIGNNTGNFTDGTGVVLAQLELGQGTTRKPITALKDSVSGEYEIAFSTEQGGVKYQYVTVALVTGGTTPSITIPVAYVAVLPEQ